MNNRSGRNGVPRKGAAPPPIHPIILAAGPSDVFLIGNSLAAAKAAKLFRAAVSNCASLEQPIVVLGWRAQEMFPCVPRAAITVMNENWERGQITSLLSGLQQVPAGDAFMIYPVDLPGLTKDLIAKLATTYFERPRGCEIVMPMFHGHAGHPAILSGALRKELKTAETARHVVYRNSRRVSFVETNCAAAVHKRERSTAKSNREI